MLTKEKRAEELTGMIFNIQRWQLHDGPGIRTLVFMKGCQLGCLWCCNPEGQTFHSILTYKAKKCVLCGRCVAACPNGANSIVDGKMEIDRKKCANCGECVKACLSKAREIVGKRYTIEEVISEVIRDRAFYWVSHGGVTVGGGEPLDQPKFVIELLEKLHNRENLHTAIETSGYGEWSSLKGILEHTDWIFYDIKHMDSERHLQLTGVPNTIILENVKKVSDFARNNSIHLTIRIPVVPGCNDSIENIQATAEFVASLKGVNEIELLPYHRFGQSKYEWLGKRYPLEGTEPPKATFMALRKEVVESCGVKCILPIPEEFISKELIKEAIERAEGKAELYSKI